ncbi:MAG: OadG family protein [Spirochaetes bacterium]|jgi:sodium pump decarboxylase gamma subunit|nr:OadG family protein [Spirochaetota bacterium]
MGIIFQGLEFMIIGVTVVFLFLITMVISMTVLRLVVTQLNKYFPEPAETASAPASGSNTQEIAVAIATAYSMKK